MFVVAGDIGQTGVLVSTDGVEWEVRPAPGPSWVTTFGVGSGGGRLIGTLYNSGTKPNLILSDDSGYSWTSIDHLVPSVGWGVHYSVEQQLWIVRIAGYGVARSLDGDNWDNHPISWANNSGNESAPFYADGNWVMAITRESQLVRSTDGITWSEIDLSDYGQIQGWKPGHGEGQWVVPGRLWGNLGGADGVFRSSNLVDWEHIAFPSPDTRGFSVHYANGVMVVTSDTGYIYRSLDAGASWSAIEVVSVSSSREAEFFDVTYGNGVWVIVGWDDSNGGGLIYTSDDEAETWTKRDYPGWQDWHFLTSVTVVDALVAYIPPLRLVQRDDVLPA